MRLPEDTASAIQTYQRVLSHSPNNEVARHNLLTLARQQGDTTLEQQLILTKSDRYSYDALLQEGLFYLGRQQYDTAIYRFSAALVQRVSAEALLQRGFAYEKTARYAEAAADYSRAIELAPSRSDGYIHRANVAFHEERYQDACLDYDQALALAPNDAVAYLNRGLANHRLGNREAACQDLVRAHELDLDAATRPLAKLCGS